MLRKAIRLWEKEWNNGDMSKEKIKRTRVQVTHGIEVPGPMEAVFALACGDLERRSHVGRKASVSYSDSGRNENNALWVEAETGEVLLQTPGLETCWMTTLYDPEHFRFHALLMNRDLAIGKYELEIERAGEGAARMSFRFMYTALNEEGNRLLDEGMEKRMARMLVCQGQAIRDELEGGGKPRAKRAELPSPTGSFRAVRKRSVFQIEADFDGDPDSMFSLACPVAELKWIDDFRFDMIYSESGVNENNCIFLEPLSALMVLSSIGLNTWWYTSLFDTENYRFQAALITWPLMVGKFDFKAEESENGKVRMTWDITYTGLSDEGNRKIEAQDFEKRIYGMGRSLGIFIKHYLEEGEMYRLNRTWVLKMAMAFLGSRARKHFSR